MEVGVRLTVKGRVQGVGFRWFVQREAQKLGLVGYVKNLFNGDVEVEAEGQRGQIEGLIDAVRTGPRFSSVRDIVVEWKPYSGQYRSFHVDF